MRIKELRIECGLTQQQLARKSGVSQGKICEYENGKVLPRVDTAARLASAIGCTLDELCGLTSTQKAV